MTTIERTAYPRFKTVLTDRELHEIYAPTQEEIVFAKATARGSQQCLALTILLKSFQRLGYFPAINEVPAGIVQHIQGGLQLPDDISVQQIASTSLYRYHKAIRTYLGVASYREGGERVAAEAIQQAAQTMSNPADLINAAVEELVRQRFELPAFSRLDHLTQRIRTQINEEFFEIVSARLTAQNQARLDDLHTLVDPSKRTEFARLKEAPGRASLSQMKALEQRLSWLEALLDPHQLLAGIPLARSKLFAEEARSLQVSTIRGMKPNRRYTLLVCLIYWAQIQTRDDLVEMFLKRMGFIHKRAEEQLAEIREQQRETNEQMVTLLSDIVQQAHETTEDSQLGWQIRLLLEAQGGTETVMVHCEQLSAYHGNNYLPLLWQFYRSYRSTLFHLIALLDIRPTTQDTSLIDALSFIKENRTLRRDLVPATIELDFAPTRWRALVTKKQDGQSWFNRRHLEVCVFSCLTTELKTGDMYVVGSEDFADYRAQLLSWKECQPMVEDYCQTLGFELTPEGFVQQMQDWLTEVAEAVDHLFPENGQLSFDKQGEPLLKRIRRQPNPQGAVELRQALVQRLPQRNLLDIVTHAQHWVNFARHFGPLSGSDPKLTEAAARYVTTVFGYGSNLGPSQTARHLQGVINAPMLAFTNHQHITINKLDAAIRDLINHYRRFDLPHFWGTGTTAAADGTQFDLYENNLLAEQHIRYGGYGGIAYYHVSDTYIALFSHFIACGVWEAVYIIDGLLKNKSDIQPDTLYADTQGQSLPVFGLAHLLGIKLMPRIRNWKDLILFRPTKDTHYEHLDGLFRASINWTLLNTHWQDLMRVLLSIKVGKILPSMILRKLGNYSRKNRLYQAFRELGRVVRTVFLLQYISDVTLRHQISATTNKMESFNGFCKWLFFGGEGIISSKHPIEQEKRIKYNHLIANAVILQNVVDMTGVLRQLTHEDYAVNPETLGTLSPYLTEHIQRFGSYVLDMDKVPDPVEFEIPITSTPRS